MNQVLAGSNKKKIKKIAIANRGEVAVRIIRAAQELEIKTVLLHSQPDKKTCAYRLADETVCIGEGGSTESYLNISANVDAAVSMKADAIHPGFGFLSENAEFARQCLTAGLTFIGPTPESIELLGDKIRAKKLVEDCEVPTLPGYKGQEQDISVLVEKSKAIGFPVIVKAAAGGGGRGMKIIRKESEVEEQLLSAKRESLAAFASDKVFLEKYLDQAKHIEFQIFAEANGSVVSLGERECSVQRRHQKIIEEAPAAVQLEPSLREKMSNDSIKIAKAAGYRGAGTVEFLYQDGQFYFLEMNTRLQVEHTVTEEVCSVDLVKAQIICAQGDLVDWKSVDWKTNFPKGHSIECRIYAEDPYNMGAPSIGKLGSCHWPSGPGRRFEVGIEKDDEMTTFYDSMFAKVIVWDEDRHRAIQKMLQVLNETIIFGVKTNIPFLKKIISHPEFISGKMTTKFIESHFPDALSEDLDKKDEVKSLVGGIKNLVGDVTGNLKTTNTEINSVSSLWNHGFWRNV